MEDEALMAVFCSDGPENGYRVPLSGAAGATRVEIGGRMFQWDGTLDEHGDARYRPENT